MHFDKKFWNQSGTNENNINVCYKCLHQHHLLYIHWDLFKFLLNFYVVYLGKKLLIDPFVHKIVKIVISRDWTAIWISSPATLWSLKCIYLTGKWAIILNMAEKDGNIYHHVNLHTMPFQNRIHSFVPFPKRHHIEHYELYTVHVFEMIRAIHTMEYRTILSQSVFSEIRHTHTHNRLNLK